MANPLAEVPILHIVVGIVTLVRDSSRVVLLAVTLLLMFGSVGTGFVRRQQACTQCQQRELGCPAERLFSKAWTFTA